MTLREQRPGIPFKQFFVERVNTTPATGAIIWLRLTDKGTHSMSDWVGLAVCSPTQALVIATGANMADVREVPLVADCSYCPLNSERSLNAHAT
jgi:hypothetical protein